MVHGRFRDGEPFVAAVPGGTTPEAGPVRFGFAPEAALVMADG
jgi:hypothetical protein